MKILLFSLVLLFSCAHISRANEIKGGSNRGVYAGGTKGYKRSECRNKGGICLDDMCDTCDVTPTYKLPVESGPFPQVPADADAKAVADKVNAMALSWRAKAAADAKAFNDAIMASWSKIWQNRSKS